MVSLRIGITLHLNFFMIVKRIFQYNFFRYIYSSHAQITWNIIINLSTLIHEANTPLRILKLEIGTWGTASDNRSNLHCSIQNEILNEILSCRICPNVKVLPREERGGVAHIYLDGGDRRRKRSLSLPHPKISELFAFVCSN